MRGSENIFVIDPLQQKKTKEGYVFNDIKKRLMHYKKNGIKLPEAYVKQYKVYQAQIDKLKELKEEYKRLEEKLHLLANQTDSLQYNVLDARIINRRNLSIFMESLRLKRVSSNCNH